MAGISTHVLNSGTGRPGAGMRIDFSVRDGDGWKLVKTVTTNADGRTDQPVLAPDAAKVGQYELLFHVGDYFRKQPGGESDPPFLDTVPVRFAIFDTQQHYHVPMLCTPWSCSTYRGS
ncbi:hydroxyisourate hydrolase [Variovorax sp. Sphag1AA]|uniref:hydroxyisourate hydrolase n=1 Tax=Variovorax sp. Sphag1AA TaxID=2587027 RepID=UPI00161CC6CF|nr:hydroxyisourate hydrolase [Variovorax sp. Sphag1AA]MBB3175634.1 5-hydroxyisourate hydrolase [Variovorax sp. Sphag1AA]MBO9647020.1 hydroxyisourate hydrolase [Variovorax sp.]